MSKLKTLEKKAGSRWRRMARWAQWTVIIVVLLLVAIRLSLPWAIEHYVNKQLSKIPDYQGHIGGVRVHIWRGAYEINDISISKANKGVPVPLFAAKSIDLSVQWKELFHGAIVAEILLDKPVLNFVSGPTEQQSQTGVNKPWGDTLASLFPFNINKFQIRDGGVHFQDFFKSEPVNLYITNLFAVATNLSNSRSLKEKLPAGLQANGDTLGGGFLDVHLKMNPLEKAPTFEVDASLTNVDMVALNQFLRSYGKLDIARGNFSLFTSVASADGNYKGNVKVLFKNLDVFEWEKERKKNILDIFWEGVVGVLSEGFRNHPHDQLATEIAITGEYGKTHVSIWSAVGNLLKNAFVRALLPTIDKKAHVEDLKAKKVSVDDVKSGVNSKKIDKVDTSNTKKESKP